MAQRSSSSTLRPIAVAVLAVAVCLIALPQSWKSWAPGFLRRPALHLGLDLAGGTQLDFRISEEEIRKELAGVKDDLAKAKENGGSAEQIAKLQNEQQSIELQQSNIVEAIRTVLERRINALGVSEATITPSFVGDEKHLLVECPGVVDTQECIKVVGKTIQLEFKEEFTEATSDYLAKVRANANTALRRITESGITLSTLGEDLGSTLGVSYQPDRVVFRDQLPKGLEAAWGMQPGKVVRMEGTVKVQTQDEQGQPSTKDVKGVFLVEAAGPLTQTGRTVTEADKAFALITKNEPGASSSVQNNRPLDTKFPVRTAAALRSMKPGEVKVITLDDGSAQILFLSQLTPGKEEVDVSHIIVTFEGASGAPDGLKRTKQEALTRIQELKRLLSTGSSFEQLARTSSDGPSAKDSGRLGVITRGQMPPPFEQVAFSLEAGKVSDVVETPFGYHLIRTNAPKVTLPDSASFDELLIKGNEAPKRAEGIYAKLQAGEVKTIEPAMSLRTLFFSFEPTGWKDTPLDGKHFRTAAVTVDNVTNIPLVQIVFDDEGAKMFQEMTKRNIGKRIAIFVGGELISAPTVQSEIIGGTAVITGSRSFDEARALAQDLNTGAIPAPIYLVGQYTVEATLGAAALQTSIIAGLIGTIILMLYMAFVYRGLGLVADIALSVYAFLLFAILKLPVLLITSDYIVLTLAGMAGIILSIGIAVDANVLVFERMKEEFRKGKSFKAAVESSFVYAWPAIRDSNISALITCAILFLIGTSIVRGFAITLGMGVLLSLFTAITVTRWLLRKAASMKIGENKWLFGS